MKQRITIGWSIWVLTLISMPVGAVQLDAEVSWTVPLTLSTSLDSRVVEAMARVGQQVNKGEPLAQLEDEVARARLSEARAELAHRKLMLAEATSELQRTEELYERTLISDHDLMVARIDHAAAESHYRQATTALAVAKRELSLTQISAPFDAIVVQRHVRAGETVNGRFTQVPIYSLVEAKRRRVVLTLTAEQAEKLSPGDELPVQAGGERYMGRVEALIPRMGGMGSETIEMELLFTTEQQLARGTRVAVTLP